MMTLQKAMNAYGHTDKEHFPCLNGFDDSERPDSLFYADFCVAEVFLESEPNAIADTYKRCGEWKSNVKMWTELIMVLNHLLWKHYNEGETELAKKYNALWLEAEEIARKFEGADALYYYRVTD